MSSLIASVKVGKALFWFYQGASLQSLWHPRIWKFCKVNDHYWWAGTCVVTDRDFGSDAALEWKCFLILVKVSPLCLYFMGVVRHLSCISMSRSCQKNHCHTQAILKWLERSYKTRVEVETQQRNNCTRAVGSIPLVISSVSFGYLSSQISYKIWK